MMRLVFTPGALAAAAMCLLAGAATAQVQNTTTKFDYDAMGNLTKVTDPLLHATTFVYDEHGRRTKATDHLNGVTAYVYDGRDQLTKVTDARSVVTDYSIDGLGELNQATSADTGVTSNTYDDAGNLNSRTDAKLQRTTYAYDVLGRVTLITFSDNNTVVYQYDQGSNAIGHLNKITDSSGSINYAYDAHGRVTSESRTIDGSVYVTAYRYDANGQLSGMSYPGGRSIDYTRDTVGRISQISTTLGAVISPLLTQVSYQPFGPVQTVTFGNGRTQTRAYDLDGRIASFTLAAQTMAVGYDAAGRITAIGDASNAATGSTYGYDDLDRLNSVVTPTVGQAFLYDKVGNRTQRSINGAATTYGYAMASNRLTTVGVQAIAMDPNGSITNKGNATFNYDARGRMVSANTAIGLVTYTINSLGQRVRKVTPTETTVFHYDMAGKLIAETTSTGAGKKTQEYVYLGDMPVAVVK